MKKIKVIRSRDMADFEDQINQFLSDHNEHIWVDDIKYTTEAVANKYNAHGVPINIVIYDTAYIYYEEDPSSVH